MINGRVEHADILQMSVVSERVVRLAGAESDTTRLAMERYGRHIVPVYDQPSRVEYLIRR